MGEPGCPPFPQFRFPCDWSNDHKSGCLIVNFHKYNCIPIGFHSFNWVFGGHVCQIWCNETFYAVSPYIVWSLQIQTKCNFICYLFTDFYYCYLFADVIFLHVIFLQIFLLFLLFLFICYFFACYFFAVQSNFSHGKRWHIFFTPKFFWQVNHALERVNRVVKCWNCLFTFANTPQRY